MSWAAAAWVSGSRFGSANRKLVMLVVAGYATEDASAIGITVPEGWAVCWASIARIAADAELSPATVRRVLSDMEAAGVIRRQHRGRKHGFGGRTTDAIWIEYGRLFVTRTDLALNPSANPVDGDDPLAETGEPDTTGGGLPLKSEGVSAHPREGVSAHLVSAQNRQVNPQSNRQDHVGKQPHARAREAPRTRSSSDGGPAPPAHGRPDDERDGREERYG